MDANKFYKKLFTESNKYRHKSLNSDEQRRWEVIQKYLSFVAGYFKAKQISAEIIEIGCGRGWLTQELSHYGKVLGIEPIAPVVEYANQLYPDLNIIHGYSDDLIAKGEKEKYDLVVSSEVIEHVPNANKDTFVKNISILLKENGFVILTTPRQEIEATYRKYSTPKQPVEDWITEKDLSELFAKYGMKAVQHDRISFRPRTRYHPFAPSIEIYQTWLFQKTN